MRTEDQDYLLSIAKRYGFDDSLLKLAYTNPVDNSMFNKLIEGALKSLETVAIHTLDYKLTAIVKLLQVWLIEKQNEFTNPSKDQSTEEFDNGEG